MQTNRLRACVLLMSIAVGGIATSQRRNPTPAQESPLIANLTAKDVRQRQRAYRQLLHERSGLVHSLLAVAGHKKRRREFADERELAVMLLGEMRCADAVDILVGDITFRPPRKMLDDSPLAPYPCVEALVRIGRPSVRGLLRDVDTMPSEDALALHVLVVQTVEGDQEIGALRIRKALAAAVGKRQKYLEALLKLYEKTPFPGAYSWQ